jgi:hypothetical protein
MTDWTTIEQIAFVFFVFCFGFILGVNFCLGVLMWRNTK